LTATLPEATARSYAWVLIHNYLPSLFHTGKVPFATGMRRLLAAFAVSF
jgi:hypothetical protein